MLTVLAVLAAGVALNIVLIRAGYLDLPDTAGWPPC